MKHRNLIPPIIQHEIDQILESGNIDNYLPPLEMLKEIKKNVVSKFVNNLRNTEKFTSYKNIETDIRYDDDDYDLLVLVFFISDKYTLELVAREWTKT